MATKIGNIRGPTGPTGSTGPPGTNGTNGVNAFTTATAGFTIPPIGATVGVTVANASWMVVGEMLWIDQAGGGVGQPGIMQVTAISGNLVTLLNITAAPTPLVSNDAANLSRLGSDGLVYTPNALATTSTRGLLAPISGNTTDFIDGTDTCQNLVNAVTPTITSVRLRSFNAVGNPNFECTQRNCGSAVANPASGTLIEDRWMYGKSGSLTGVVSIQKQGPANAASGAIAVPGTNFLISNGFFRVTLTTAQASLAAGDWCGIIQSVEGPMLRELWNDVHSLSLLVRSSVAISFGLTLRGGSSTYSLSKLCTISSANTFVLIPLPNLPVWPSAFNSIAPGALGYQIYITLAAGTTQTSPANDTWQSGAYTGAVGQSNFLAAPVNSTFDIAFVQHEPGPLCTTLIDCPFDANLRSCQRYLQKTYGYSVKPGSVDNSGSNLFFTPVAGATLQIPIRFPVTLAKVPTMTLYSNISGAPGVIRNATTAADLTAIVQSPQDSGYSWINITGTAPAASANLQWHHTADTGW